MWYGGLHRLLRVHGGVTVPFKKQKPAKCFAGFFRQEFSDWLSVGLVAKLSIRREAATEAGSASIEG